MFQTICNCTAKIIIFKIFHQIILDHILPYHCSNCNGENNCLGRSSCHETPCLNNGICEQDDHGLSRCQCKRGWSGDYCENDVDECMSIKPCFNDGICINLKGDYLCKCKQGFIGRHCETQFVMRK